ncbi:hypothetical protein MPLA_2130081 [Mesorhizobium sp. ORS 3359]|nr:hypothetical protein MPLA_2130081 [Mesorhizobium sp. ORS 3359]
MLAHRPAERGWGPSSAFHVPKWSQGIDVSRKVGCATNSLSQWDLSLSLLMASLRVITIALALRSGHLVGAGAMQERLDFVQVYLPIAVLVHGIENPGDRVLHLVFGQSSVSIGVQKSEHQSHSGTTHHPSAGMPLHSSPLVSAAVTMLLPAISLSVLAADCIGAALLFHPLLHGLLYHLADHLTRWTACWSAGVRHRPRRGGFGRRARRRRSGCLRERGKGDDHQGGGNGRCSSCVSHCILLGHCVCLRLFGPDPNRCSIRLFPRPYPVAITLLSRTIDPAGLTYSAPRAAYLSSAAL